MRNAHHALNSNVGTWSTSNVRPSRKNEKVLLWLSTGGSKVRCIGKEAGNVGLEVGIDCSHASQGSDELAVQGGCILHI